MKNSVKYDRQIRLWKEHGQMRLEAANVCLLGGTSTGTEIMKNLILPGIQSFTIVDEKTITNEDLGNNNFFISLEWVGKSKAECLAENLRDLNQDVQGFHLNDSPQKVIQNNPNFFEKFQLIIASGLEEGTLVELDNLLRRLGKPLVICNSYGFMGYLRLVIPETLSNKSTNFPAFIKVIEPHVENSFDLRLDCPWPELKEFVDSMDLESMDPIEQAHVPYIVLLIKALDEWKLKHNTVPRGSDERQQFKQIINSLVTNTESTENVEEAHSQVFRINYSAPNLLDISPTLPMTFKVLLNALLMFVRSQGKLPLPGIIPDMKADTTTFVALQKVYRDKALKDFQMVKKFVVEILQDSNHETISDETIERFCKNAANLFHLKYRSLSEEVSNPNVSFLSQCIEIEEKNAIWFVAYKTCLNFYSQYKRFPGQHEDDFEKDLAPLKKLNSLVPIPDEYLHEICRYGAAELHNIASLMGGIASQECVKIITEQYVPLNNTLIFDGTESKCWVFEA